jgi:predicted  nucleic acid-binding Zn-ribbon protein
LLADRLDVVEKCRAKDEEDVKQLVEKAGGLEKQNNQLEDLLQAVQAQSAKLRGDVECLQQGKEQLSNQVHQIARVSSHELTVLKKVSHETNLRIVSESENAKKHQAAMKKIEDRTKSLAASMDRILENIKDVKDGRVQDNERINQVVQANAERLQAADQERIGIRASFKRLGEENLVLHRNWLSFNKFTMQLSRRSSSAPSKSHWEMNSFALI